MSFIGGAESSLLTILGKVKQAAHIPVVLCPSMGPLVERLKGLGVRTVPFDFQPFLRTQFLAELRNNPRGAMGLVSNFLKSQTYLFHQLIKEKPTLIHANSWVIGQYCADVINLLNIPSLCHVRDVPSLDCGNMKMTTETIQPIKKFSRIIAISEFTRRRLIELGIDESKIATIYNGVDLDVFDPSVSNRKKIRSEWQVSEDITVVTMLGQICNRKNQLGLLKAAQILKHSNKKFVVILVGPEFDERKPVTKELEIFIKEHELEDFVKILPFRSDVADIISASDIIVSASHDEPFGRTLIEGMAMKKPIVATRSGAHPEIIKDGTTGLLVEENCPEALSDAILNLSQNPETAIQMGEVGRQRAQEKFSVEAHLQNLNLVYKEITGSSIDFWIDLQNR